VSAAEAPYGILTPDQRPRVFISSTLVEMAPERVAARRAVESLRLIPVMFELGARPHPARSLYRAYLAQSHIFVGLYAQRYGWVAPEESISGLEDEYHLSAGLPRLVYLRTPADREARLEALLDRVREDDTVSYRSFRDPEELEQLLREDLAVVLAERFLVGDRPDPAQGARTGRVHQLPRPLTDLVGRDAETTQVRSLLDGGARLVTLVGPGGIGKTRVALDVAHGVARTGREVAFVPLDAVRDPKAVLPAIGSVLGIGLDGSVPAAETLGRALRNRDLLLVLDNMEQVVECAPEVTALLQACPGVTVLATSRAALRIRGEQQVPIGPLTLPDGDRGGLDQYAAVRLFMERAREARPGLTLDDPAEAAAVAELTKRLEGIPLALELAAARTKTLPPRALLARVDSALDLSTGAVDVPARQRTLRDTVAWSEELLPPHERRLFTELSVFEAPWTLADAEAVASPESGDVLDGVADLVEQSLVYPSTRSSGEPRFRMYDAVRAYARERQDAADATATQDRLIARMAVVVRELDVGFRSAEHDRWRSEFRLVWPDIKTALELAIEREQAAHATQLSRAWVGMWMDGRVREIEPLMQAAMDLVDRLEPPEQGDMLLAGVGLRFNMGDYEAAQALISRIRAGIPLQSEDEELPGTLELYEGYLAAGEGDVESAQRHMQEAVRLLSECGPGGGWIEAFAHNGLGSLYALRGDVAGWRREMQRSGDLGRQYGNVGAQLQSLVFQAAGLVPAGQTDEAKGLLREAADLVQRYPFYEANAYCVEVAGLVALQEGDAPAAARALGMADALREVVGARVWPLLAMLRAGIEQSVRSALDEDAYRREVILGREVDLLTLADVVRGLVS
jgi:predicted ATPase